VTFSIVAFDGSVDPPEWGVAVASKFLAVGAVVPWAKAGAGALATQALANLAYGPEGIDRLTKAQDAASVVDALTQADEGREDRQLGVVDAQGNAATFTGAQCFDWAGGKTGDGYCCQGNILTGPEVVDRMAEAFEEAEGSLASRLLVALAAGDAAGGDSRGRQSAALLIVREGGGYGGGIDKAVDLRVEDHTDPVNELFRIFGIHELLFPRAEDLEFSDIDDALASELREILTGMGLLEKGDAGTGYDEAVKKALYAYVGTENLEERWSDEAKIERGVLEHLRANKTRAPGYL
jgi:uncharacterized Ntn-hydrolase superfamily protein